MSSIFISAVEKFDVTLTIFLLKLTNFCLTAFESFSLTLLFGSFLWWFVILDHEFIFSCVLSVGILQDLTCISIKGRFAFASVKISKMTDSGWLLRLSFLNCENIYIFDHWNWIRVDHCLSFLKGDLLPTVLRLRLLNSLAISPFQ